MPWVRIDDEFPHHPKVATVGPLGVALQVAGLCYANHFLTDGFIPFGAVRTLLDFNRIGENIGDRVEVWVEVGGMSIANALVEAGMWEEVDGGFQIHDFADYQPSRAEVLAEREKTRGRVAKHRAGKKNRNRGGNAVTTTVGNTSSNGPVTGAPVPVPVPHRVTTGDPSAETSVVTTGVEQARPIDDTTAVFQTWIDSLGDNRGRLRLTPKRRTVIKARLAEYPAADVIDAARGWVNDPWPERPHHNDLTVLLRNGEQLEKFRDLWRHGPPATMGKHTSQAVQFAHQMQAMRPAEGVTDDLGRMDGRGAVAQRQLPRPEA